MSREKPAHTQMVTFCRYHLGKHCFAAFSGGDWPAWSAFVYLLQSHVTGGGQHAIDAMRSTVRAAQHANQLVMQVFVQTIAGVLDWSSVVKLWPLIVDDLTLDGRMTSGERFAKYLCAVDRREVYSPVEKCAVEKKYLHGLQRPIEPTLAQGAAR